MEPDRALVGVEGVESALDHPRVVTDVVPETTLLPFAEFYRDERRRLVRAMALTVGDPDLAADAIDEAFARAYQRWSRIGSYRDPAAWVFKVGLNWARSVRRRIGRQPVPPAPASVELAPLAEPSLAAALRDLPVDQRAVVVCRFYLNLSELETAEALETRPGTVKSRTHRALRTLESRVAHLSPREHR